MTNSTLQCFTKNPELVRYEKYIALCPKISSDYTLCNIFSWQDYFGFTFTEKDNLIWLEQTKNTPQAVNWAPIGDWDTIDWKNCETLQEKRFFSRVPYHLMEIWKKTFKDKVLIFPNYDQWDYIYCTQELIELSGNIFHKKKNLLAQFLKNYEYSFHAITKESAQDLIAMQNIWLENYGNDSKELLTEHQAICSILEQFDCLKNLSGAYITVQDKIVAFTIGEPLNDEMFLIHFEKGLTEYKGVYQAINQLFLQHMVSNYSYVNREQDLGNENLRKAKLSYNPVDYMKKYDVEFLS